MSVNKIFPSIQLTEAEIVELQTHLSAPVVVKYLTALAVEDSKELLTFNALDMPAQDIANRHLLVTGKLEVLTTLLSIKE